MEVTLTVERGLASVHACGEGYRHHEVSSSVVFERTVVMSLLERFEAAEVEVEEKPTGPEETPEKNEESFLDVRADELEDLFCALSQTPEVDIRTRSEGSKKKTTPKTDVRPQNRETTRVIRSTRSANTTPSNYHAATTTATSSRGRVRAGKSVEDMLKLREKTDLLVIACDLLDYITGRTKMLKQESLLQAFQKQCRVPNEH